MSYTSGAPAQAVRLWLTWLAIALLGTIGVFSMFDGLAEGDVEAGWSGVLILSVIVLSLLHKRPGFRRAVDPALESLRTQVFRGNNGCDVDWDPTNGNLPPGSIH